MASTTAGAASRTSAPVSSFTATAPDTWPALCSSAVTRWRCSSARRPAPGPALAAACSAATMRRASARAVPQTTW